MKELPHFPSARNTPGVFLEHFDLGSAEGGVDQIIYRRLYETAMRAAEVAGWGFRSFSAAATSGTRADFMERNIRSFPTLILYRDGAELGRQSFIYNTVRGIFDWAVELLGEDFDFPESVLVVLDEEKPQIFVNDFYDESVSGDPLGRG